MAHAAALPTTLEEISDFPVAYRHQIVGALSAETKSRLWREQLGKALRENQGFTTEQRAAISKVMTALTPDVFLAQRNPPAGSPIAEFCQTSKALFTDRQRSLFSTLGDGPAKGSYRNAQVARLLIAKKVRERFIVDAGNWDCYCSIDSYCDCPFDSYCKGGPCQLGGWDCGCFWIWQCDGWCYP
jgi:hypothetical protein